MMMEDTHWNAREIEWQGSAQHTLPFTLVTPKLPRRREAFPQAKPSCTNLLPTTNFA